MIVSRWCFRSAMFLCIDVSLRCFTAVICFSFLDDSHMATFKMGVTIIYCLFGEMSCSLINFALVSFQSLPFVEC